MLSRIDSHPSRSGNGGQAQKQGLTFPAPFWSHTQLSSMLAPHVSEEPEGAELMRGQLGLFIPGGSHSDAGQL